MGLFDSIKSLAAPILGTVGSIFGGPIGGTIGTAIGGFASNLGKKVSDAAPGIATDLASSALQNYFFGQPNADNAFNQSLYGSAVSFDRSYNAYKRRYQDTVADLKAAGLNPILAATGGLSVGNAPTMAQPQAFQAHQPPIFGTQSAKNIADTRLSDKKAEQAVAETYLARAKKGLVKAEEKVAYKNVSKILSEIRLNAQKAFEAKGKGEQAWQNVKNLIKQKEMLELEIEKLKKISAVYSNPGGQTIAYVEKLLGMIPGIGLLIGAGGRN
jgi:hypothetical protein